MLGHYRLPEYMFESARLCVLALAQFIASFLIYKGLPPTPAPSNVEMVDYH